MVKKQDPEVVENFQPDNTLCIELQKKSNAQQLTMDTKWMASAKVLDLSTCSKTEG